MSYIVADHTGQFHATDRLDDWRRDYQAGKSSRDGVMAVYETLAGQFPDQNYYAADHVADFISRYQPDLVVELGGWDGALAQTILWDNDQIQWWDNHEVANVPQVCDDLRYTFNIRQTRWLWDEPIVGDAFVASHVLEHISDQQLVDLVAALECSVAYVDVPLGDQRHDWMRSPTTHVMTYSISEFDRVWSDAGWRIVHTVERGGPVPSHIRFLEAPACG